MRVEGGDCVHVRVEDEDCVHIGLEGGVCIIMSTFRELRARTAELHRTDQTENFGSYQ